MIEQQTAELTFRLHGTERNRNVTVLWRLLYMEIFAGRKLSPISPSALIGEIFITQIFLSCVNDYIEDMVTFTALVKIYSTEYFCNTRLGEIFVKEKFSRILDNNQTLKVWYAIGMGG